MRVLAVVALLATGCERPAVEREPVSLRVGTSWGLEAPTGGISGSMTAHVLELIAGKADGRLNVLSQGEAFVRLSVTSRDDLRTVAERLSHRDLAKVSIEGDAIVATFRTGVPPPSELLISDGPFAVISFEHDVRLVLQRRAFDAERIDVLDFRNFSSEEELWRRFLAEEVDVVIVGSLLHRRRIESVPTVRIAEVSSPTPVFFHLNVASPRLSDRDVRKALSIALNRQPIAEAATGSPKYAFDLPYDSDAAGSRLRALNLRLVILFDQSSGSLMRGLRVAERQLSSVGVSCEFVASDVGAILARLEKGDYDILAFFGSLENDSLPGYVTGAQLNLTGYSNPEFDAAIKSGDLKSAREVLQSDVPVIPLYRVPQLFAYHTRFCGLRPLRVADLRWLADVRLCQPGEND